MSTTHSPHVVETAMSTMRVATITNLMTVIPVIGLDVLCSVARTMLLAMLLGSMAGIGPATPLLVSMQLWITMSSLLLLRYTVCRYRVTDALAHTTTSSFGWGWWILCTVSVDLVLHALYALRAQCYAYSVLALVLCLWPWPAPWSPRSVRPLGI